MHGSPQQQAAVHFLFHNTKVLRMCSTMLHSCVTRSTVSINLVVGCWCPVRATNHQLLVLAKSLLRQRLYWSCPQGSTAQLLPATGFKPSHTFITAWDTYLCDTMSTGT